MAQKPTYEELEHRVKELQEEANKSKQVEEALGTMHRKLQATFDAIQETINVVDLDFNLTDVNDILIRAFGLPDKKSALGRKCFEVLKGRKDMCPNCAVAEVYRTKAAAYRMSTPEDEASTEGRSFEIFAYPIMDQVGNLSGAVEFARDVTKRKQAEEAQKESEQRFRELADLLPQPVFELDLEGKFTYSNRCGFDTFGYSHKDLANGVNALELFIPEERQRVWQNIQNRLAGKEFDDHEYTGLGKDGSTFPMLVYSAPIVVNNKIIGVRGIILDITERKRTEEALKNAHDELERLVEERTAELSKANEELHREIEERKRAEEGLRESYRKLQIAHDQSIIYARELHREIEERKAAEEAKAELEAQLLQAQKMEAIGILAGGISHDFNNILQAISGYSQLLLMRKEKDDSDTRYLNQIDRSMQRAVELTQQLLTFSRKVESKLRPVDLNREVIQAHDVLIRTIPKMIDIELNLVEDLKLINADPVQLEQIMMNLGVNAKDAMPDGGKLVFQTQETVLDEKYCATHLGATPGEYVMLTISDTGHGMDKDTVQHIFEPFYTTKETGKGTGLGLAMVYGIVKSHGGYIMCNSEPGHGTDFRIYFPVLEEESRKKTAVSKEKEKIIGGEETILLVDDEEPLLELGQDMLQQYGYTTITAESGEKGIETYKLGKGQIDLVILDIGMPGMGGYKCLQELLKIDPEIKVIISSGYPKDEKVNEMLKSGAAGFIGKPYRLTEMLEKVREILDGK